MAFTKEKLAGGWTRNNPGMGSSYYTRPSTKNPKGRFLVDSETKLTVDWWLVGWYLKYAPDFEGSGYPSWTTLYGPFGSVEDAFKAAEGK
jgi:hypothetical protein|tara:strand:+ start:3945 stop:4214 length:270 start_codon:yes stop_codon:yes gene_type:complete